MYYWRAKNSNGVIVDLSQCGFDTKGEAYKDMRNAVFENIQYDESFNIAIKYDVIFLEDGIRFGSDNGKYTYEVYERNVWSTDVDSIADIKREIEKAKQYGTNEDDIEDYLRELEEEGIIGKVIRNEVGL